MPIRAYCTICSDFFDHSRDVAAIFCGHTFHYSCLLQWFQSAPTKTCPQCRKQVSTRHIISKLFFDVAPEEEGSTADPESLQNELDRMKVVLCEKERDWRDKQRAAEALRDLMEKQKAELERVRREIGEKEMLCTTLRKQMQYLETQQRESETVKEEAKRLRLKMKTYESLATVLQGQRAEVEVMISDMGVGQSAVEQLSIYCISLKKEYDSLKDSLRSSSEMCEKLKREVFSSNKKLQKATLEMNQAKEDLKALQNDLTNSDKEITSLKKKVEILQKTLSTPTRTNEAISRLVFESPAPVELQSPRLHQPSHSQDIDLNVTFDISTPEHVEKKPVAVPLKRPLLPCPSVMGHKHFKSKISHSEEDRVSQDPMFRNSLLFRKKMFSSMLEPHSKAGAVRTGYDGLGGRTKFIQSCPLADMKAKRKKVSRPAQSKVTPNLPTLDAFLE